FAGYGRLLRREPGDISTRPRKVRYETASNRIADRRKNYWDRACRLLECNQGWRGVGHEHIRHQADKFGRKVACASSLVGSPAIVDADVGALDPCEFGKALLERLDAQMGLRIALKNREQHANPAYWPDLLRAHR